MVTASASVIYMSYRSDIHFHPSSSISSTFIHIHPFIFVHFHPCHVSVMCHCVSHVSVICSPISVMYQLCISHISVTYQSYQSLFVQSCRYFREQSWKVGGEMCEKHSFAKSSNFREKIAQLILFCVNLKEFLTLGLFWLVHWFHSIYLLWGTSICIHLYLHPPLHLEPVLLLLALPCAHKELLSELTIIARKMISI